MHLLTSDVVGLLADLDKAGIPAGEVRTLDRVYKWDQTKSQGLLLEVEHSTLGKINLPGPPLRFDAHSVTADHRPPPTLGQHSESVRHWLDEAGSAVSRAEVVVVSDRLSAEDFVNLVLDPGSLKRWDEPVVPTRTLDPGYAAGADARPYEDRVG